MRNATHEQKVQNNKVAVLFFAMLVMFLITEIV